MALTPVEIRHIKPSRSLLGYNRKGVDELLEDVVESFEQVWRERADLGDKFNGSKRTSCATASSRRCFGRRSSRRSARPRSSASRLAARRP